jgi:tRNA-uridine 2-sulfurtransferase
MKERIVVAMSGGVDSSVAAGLLVEQGHDVIGVHMKLHDATGGSPGHCCGLEDVLDARRVADTLGIPFYVLNLKTAFERAVMDNLANEYLAGRTPNPCVHCNGVLKFDVLLKRVMALGASHLATGHYARIDQDGPVLRTGRSDDKDQSYFLFPIQPKALSKTLFPLGDLTKDQVRELASRMNLVTAAKPESQEICFIPDDDHTRFVSEHRPDVDGSGQVVDMEGNVLAEHDAYWRYTIGQRRGLGVALGRPAYVIRVEPETKRVVVGFEDDQFGQCMTLRDCNWFARPEPNAVTTARIRHKGRFHACTVGQGDTPAVRFLEPVKAIAPGQAAVIYDGDRVLGGGWIV